MKIKKALFTGTVMIFLGAIGSGIWENIFKPLSGTILNFILSISTLGVESFKSEIYVEISKGFHEGLSLGILSLMLSMMLGFTLAIFLIKLFVDSDKTSPIRKVFKFQYSLINRKTFIILYLLFFTAFTSIIFLHEVYVNKAITYYQQLETIAAPYLNQDQKLKIESSFAQISNKQDYVDIVNQLTLIIKDNNQIVPDFGDIF